MLKTLACPLAGLRPTSVGLTTNDPGAGTMGERDSSWFPRQVGLGMCVGNWRLPSFPLGPALSVVSLSTQKGPRPPQQALTPPTPSGQSAEPPREWGSNRAGVSLRPACTPGHRPVGLPELLLLEWTRLGGPGQVSQLKASRSPSPVPRGGAEKLSLMTTPSFPGVS